MMKKQQFLSKYKALETMKFNPKKYLLYLMCHLFFCNTTVALANENKIDWALEQSEQVLVKNALYLNIKDLGKRPVIAAGSGQFATLWTRDFAFASLGALALNHSEPVRGGLEALFKYQRSDGLLPRRIDGVGNVLKTALRRIGIHLPPPKVIRKAEYKSGLGGTPIDSNALIAWVAEKYINKTQDQKFASVIWPKLELAFQWLKGQEVDGLLNQEPYADWKDVTRRKGQVMYSNALYYRGLLSMAEIAKYLHLYKESELYEDYAKNLKSNIQKKFWSENLGFFIDRAQDSDDALFAADGNFFAIYFGIATEAQAESIFQKSELLLKDKVLNLYANVDQPYPNSFVPKSVRMMGIKGYSDNTYVYPWNTALYVLATLTYPNEQNKIRALTALKALVEVIDRHGFQEAYEPEGEPVKRWAHKSEPDFSWFAGFMALAAHESIKAHIVLD